MASLPLQTAAIALRLAACGSTSCYASDAWTHADVSGDGQVTSLDALRILQGWLGGAIGL